MGRSTDGTTDLHKASGSSGSVRPYYRSTSDDREFIEEGLRSFYGEGHLGEDYVADVEYIRAELHNHLRSKVNCTVVAEGKGFLLGCLTWPWYRPLETATEMLLYVLPEHRTGTTAMRLIKKWEFLAKSRGAKVITAGTTIGYRTDAVTKLYTKLGFTHVGALYRKEI